MAMSISSITSSTAAAATKSAKAASAQAGTKTATTDPRDLNKDGVVTAAEIAAYNLTHGIQATGQAADQSTGQASGQAAPKLDLYA